MVDFWIKTITFPTKNMFFCFSHKLMGFPVSSLKTPRPFSQRQDVWRHALDRDGQVKLFEAEDFGMPG